MSGFATARQKMVDGQVRPSDVTDIRILDAMLAVPREAFVPENKQALAYLDLDLDVSEGGVAPRFLIKPVVLAKMLQAAEIKETDRVLVVGCATGYAAAVIAQFAPQVTATESDSALARRPPMGTRQAHPMMSSCCTAQPRSCRTSSTGNCGMAAGWSAFLRRHGRRGPPS